MKKGLLEIKYDEFIENYNLPAKSQEANWRRFVNYQFFSQFQPGRLDTDGDLLDQICVDSQTFPQVQGAFFLMNDQIISEPQDIDDILQRSQKGLLELYFLTFGDTSRFTEQLEKLWLNLDDIEKNEKWIEILAYATSRSVMSRWTDNPILKIVSYDNDGNKPEFQLSSALKEYFSYVDSIKIDKTRLLEISNSNENIYKPKMEWNTFFPISGKSEKFGSAFVVCISAQELIQLMITPDGLLRRNIFDDNVRDSQGNTAVNQEISSTLNAYPDRFVLFNNGITIVCKSISFEDNKYVLENPQIVNGCQTCSRLYQAYRNKTNLDNVQIIAKIIGSNKPDVTQGIVRGANRQNIVYEEAFETIKGFHKNLEKYFESMQVNGYPKIYYERRAKQYAENTKIKPQQKITFRSLIQSMVALFLNHVEDSHRHEYTLLKTYKDNLFIDAHSYQPYYLAALLYLNVDSLFRTEELPKELRGYKMHIMLLIKEMRGGPSPDLSSEDIDPYCDRLLSTLEKGSLEQYAQEACKKFEEIRTKWIHKKGKQYQYGIKDNAQFRNFLNSEIYGAPDDRDAEKLYTGYVLNINLDRHNTLYGFIEHTPHNIYFHEFDNPDIMRSYAGKKVSYKIVQNGNRSRAINVRLIE